MSASLVLTMAAVILISITAMVRHSTPGLDTTRSSQSMQKVAFDGSKERIEALADGAGLPRVTIHRVSGDTQGSKLDPTGLLFDLKRVVDQKPEAVAQVLRESPVLWPDERPGTGALRGKYKRGKVEIGYAGEAARFITIHFSQCKQWKSNGTNSRRCVEAEDFTRYRYQQNVPDLLQALGLPKDQRPSLNNTAVLMWNGASGIHQVSVIPNDLGGISYIQVISNRLYACLLERTELECQSS